MDIRDKKEMLFGLSASMHRPVTDIGLVAIAPATHLECFTINLKK